MKNLGEQFIWWYGVVEDRKDPLELGRVRVRCYGWHTEDKQELPTEDLPWAQPIQDVTSAALGGIGKSATGMLEGTWVVGFFADGDEAQRPVVMGSLAGIPTSTPEAGKGFADPKGAYPKQYNTSDTPTLAKDDAEEEQTLVAKRAGKFDDVPTATATHIFTVKEDRYESAHYAVDEENNDTRPKWSEPNPRYGGETKDTYPESITTSQSYPYNHVWKSEQGHVHEVDDTPGAERLHRYHKTGTFEEIQPDGTRVTKVVGSDYEVVVGEDKIYIQGNQTITVAGNAKLYVQGDHYTEVDGNQYVTVRGDRVTMIQGNDLKEIMSDETTQINGNKTLRVSGDRRTTIDGFYNETIGKDNVVKIKKNEERTVFVNSSTMVNGNTKITTTHDTNIGSGDLISVASGDNMKLRSITNTEVVVGTSMATTVGTTKTIGVGQTMATTTGGTYDVTAGGDVTVIGGPNIELNPDP